MAHPSTIAFECMSCGYSLRVPGSLSNTEGACPRCRKIAHVPLVITPALLVDLFKEPGLTLGPEIQARTFVPSKLIIPIWLTILVWIVREKEAFFETIGRRGDWTLLLVACWALGTYFALRVPWGITGGVYRRYTGKLPQSDVAGFADAGGFDIARVVPLLTLIALYLVYRATFSPVDLDPIAIIRNPWLFTVTGMIASSVLAWIAAHAVFTARFGGAAVADQLVQALAHQQDPTRIAAAGELVELGDERAVDELTGALCDPNPQLRWKAARSLGKLGDLRAKPALLAALRDEKKSVRWEAHRALRRLERMKTTPRAMRRGRSRAGSVTEWKTVYVFISSTFHDMHAERDYLVKHVFPVVREWCERRRLRLIDVDLRWGVTEQDATNRDALRICLNRIDECRPFFLCFLGQRRGWVPRRDEVSRETFDSFPELSPFVGASSITELEILHALFKPMHGAARDPARSDEYYESAKHAFFYLRDPSYLAELPADPPQLRRVYTNEGLPDDSLRDEYDRELTRWREELIPGSGRPWRAYTARWNPNASTPELLIPLQCPPGNDKVIRQWREQWSAAGVAVAGLDVEDDRFEATKAHAFNRSLSRGRLTGFTSGGRPLSEAIIRDLQEAISARYPDHREAGPVTELQREIDLQEQFLVEALDGFIERDDDFVELDRYIASDSNELCVLAGPAGGRQVHAPRQLARASPVAGRQSDLLPLHRRQRCFYDRQLVASLGATRD